MKLLKIRVRFNGVEMTYPPGFLGIDCLEHLYYDDLKSGICYLMVAIRDEDLAKIKDMTDVTELTLAQAEAINDQYEPKKEVLTDPVKIQRLEIKAKAGEKLSADELKALDPNDPTTGIGYAVRFIEKVKMRM